MDSDLWITAIFFLVFLLFAIAESASQLISKHKVQMVLDGLRENSRISRRLLPENASTLRSILTIARMIAVSALVVTFTTLVLTRSPIVWVTVAILLAPGALYLPTLIAFKNPKSTLTTLLYIIRFANIFLMPIAQPRNWLFGHYRSLARKKNIEMEQEEEAHQIEAYLEEAREQGIFEPDEADMMRQVVEFGDTIVKEVMTPRVNMECTEHASTLKEFTHKAADLKFSRFPVIDGKIDNVIGIAHIKSLLNYQSEGNGDTTVSEIMVPPYFVPESKKVSTLLRDFQNNKQQIAIVVDEYGGTAGLITLEDILEELVGEIEDEHDIEEEVEEIINQQDGSLIVSGNVDVSEVEKILNVALDDQSYETVSGLALSHLKHIPKIGEEFVTGGIRVKIIDADEKSINKLKMTKLKSDE